MAAGAYPVISHMEDDHAEPVPGSDAPLETVTLPAHLVVAITRLLDNKADHDTHAAPSRLTVVRINVGDTPTPVLGQNKGRKRAYVRNAGAVSVYVHGVDGVTPGTGYEMTPGSTLPGAIEGTSVLYAITDPANVGRLDVLIELCP